MRRNLWASFVDYVSCNNIFMYLADGLHQQWSAHLPKPCISMAYLMDVGVTNTIKYRGVNGLYGSSVWSRIFPWSSLSQSAMIVGYIIDLTHRAETRWSFWVLLVFVYCVVLYLFCCCTVVAFLNDFMRDSKL